MTAGWPPVISRWRAGEPLSTAPMSGDGKAAGKRPPAPPLTPTPSTRCRAGIRKPTCLGPSSGPKGLGRRPPRGWPAPAPSPWRWRRSPLWQPTRLVEQVMACQHEGTGRQCPRQRRGASGEGRRHPCPDTEAAPASDPPRYRLTARRALVPARRARRGRLRATLRQPPEGQPGSPGPGHGRWNL